MTPLDVLSDMGLQHAQLAHVAPSLSGRSSKPNDYVEKYWFQLVKFKLNDYSSVLCFLRFEVLNLFSYSRWNWEQFFLIFKQQQLLLADDGKLQNLLILINSFPDPEVDPETD